MTSTKLILNLLSICQVHSLLTHQLYPLTPAPNLQRHLPHYNPHTFRGYQDQSVNVYRDTNDITDQSELTDAIRTQDNDHVVSENIVLLIMG